MEKPVWYTFQEKIKNHFSDLGVIAETNVTIKGVRTSHDVDILVTSKYLGQNIKWIVEAKHWNNNIPKLHVLALKNIVDETGADKGFIISQKGFQSGAIEAAYNTNITLLTFEQFISSTNDIIEDKILDTYIERFICSQTRYWSHSKEVRIKYGLRRERHDYFPEFSVQFIIHTISNAITLGKSKIYPFELNTSLPVQFGDNLINNFKELINWLNINFNVIDKKMIEAEIEMQRNGDFNPQFYDFYEIKGQNI